MHGSTYEYDYSSLKMERIFFLKRCILDRGFSLESVHATTIDNESEPPIQSRNPRVILDDYKQLLTPS